MDCAASTDASRPAGFQQRKQIIARAQDIINEARDPHEKPFDHCVSVAEMGWEGAVEHIPPDGAISYADPAAKAGAEEALLRRFAWMLVSTGVLRQVVTDH
ncbi:putative o-methyltransferase [Neofusicoccum parvum]|nr:putative o-methyltransferase [Neofusicoccum parvum]